MSTTPPKHLLCRISSQVYNALGEIHRRRIQKWDNQFNQWWQIKLVERLQRHFLSGFAFFEVFWLILSCLTNERPADGGKGKGMLATGYRLFVRQILPTTRCAFHGTLSGIVPNNDCWVSISGSGSGASFFAKPKNWNGTATLENLQTWNLLLGCKG